MKQSSLDEQEQMGMEMESQQSENDEDGGDYFRSYADPNLNSNAPGPGGEGPQNCNMLYVLFNKSSFSHGTGQKEQFSPVIPLKLVDRLPWTPKVRQKDIDQFLDASRSKFIGFTLPDDNQSLAGLPLSIHEGFRTLNKVTPLLNQTIYI